MANNSSFDSKIPTHLLPFIAVQDASLYTPMDHAAWRYILKVSYLFFSKHAHQKYQNGLKETGISVERIPLISEMDECLRKFNWRAVPVTGFIPPAVFMEFLSLGILPIACDMRTLDHLAYTPAPDIVHEAAGHAPIISDPEYSDYLRSYGEISRKAIFSTHDMDVYQAIRLLSDTKEDPASSREAIQSAQNQLDAALKNVAFDSEATLLARMGWWTFEYGLLGSLHGSNPSMKIYGAGLLSSMEESLHCLEPTVKKIPFSVDCIKTSYDITRPQPQLFVSPDFHTLKKALEELADQMAFRRGGVVGLERAREAGTVTTTVLDTGVQISGVLKDFRQDETGNPYYLFFSGPTQISYQDEELPGQGPQYHSHGFSTPLETITEETLKTAGLSLGKVGRLLLSSEVVIEGKLLNMTHREGRLILLTFEECTIKMGDEVLFRPEWGKFDLACGKQIVSVFGGASDRQKYLEATGGFHQEQAKQKSNLTVANRDLNPLYAEVRRIRESGDWNETVVKRLDEIHDELEEHYPLDWLLRFELLELSVTRHLNPLNALNLQCESQLKTRLEEISHELPAMSETIQRGLKIILVQVEGGA